MAPSESPSCEDKGETPGKVSAASPGCLWDAPTLERLPARNWQAIGDHTKNCIETGEKETPLIAKMLQEQGVSPRATLSCTAVAIAAGERTQGCPSPASLRTTRSLLGCCAGVQGIHTAGSFLCNSFSSSTAII